MEDFDMYLDEDIDMFSSDEDPDCIVLDDNGTDIPEEECFGAAKLDEKQISKSPSFYVNSISESRNRYASSLESELGYKNIHIYGSFEYDPTHGGFNRTTGQKILSAINNARGAERISDYTYRQLLDKLDDACYYI